MDGRMDIGEGRASPEERGGKEREGDGLGFSPGGQRGRR